jgi:hypothetical protein
MQSIRERYGVVHKEGDIGIEIEVEGHGYRDFLDPEMDMGEAEVANNWLLKGDGSLRGEDHGEFVIARPVGVKKVRKALEELVAWVRERKRIKWEPSQRCGVHIHVNVQEMTEETVLTYGTMALLLEPLLLQYSGVHRVGNIYCMSAQDAHAIIGQLMFCAKQGTYRHLSENYKYSSVNFLPITRYGSVEFRSMRTPELHDVVNVIEDWAHICHRIKEASQMYASPSDIIGDMSALGPKGFVEQVMGDKAPKLLCKEFDGMLYRSARAVQQLAYYGWQTNEPEHDADRPPRRFGDDVAQGILDRNPLLNRPPAGLRWVPQDQIPQEIQDDMNVLDLDARELEQIEAFVNRRDR